jgi:hypothetical protein
MDLEIKFLAGTILLGVLNIMWAANVRTKQYGIDWNMGARDEQMPPLDPLAGRLLRAQANFLETFPLFCRRAPWSSRERPPRLEDRTRLWIVFRRADHLSSALCWRNSQGSHPRMVHGHGRIAPRTLVDGVWLTVPSHRPHEHPMIAQGVVEKFAAARKPPSTASVAPLM